MSQMTQQTLTNLNGTYARWNRMVEDLDNKYGIRR